MDFKDTYSMQRAAKLTGVPESSLQNWVDRRFIQPTYNLGPGRGRGKRWTLRDMIGLRAINQLRQQGVSLQRVRKVTAALRNMKNERSTLEALASSRLVVLPDGTVAVMSDQQMIDIMTKQHLMGGFLAVDLEPVVRDVTERVAKFEAEEAAKREQRKARRRKRAA